MTQSRLIVDVDNVLWDAYPWTIEAANRIFDRCIIIEDVGDWHGWEKLLGKNWFDAFTEALDPARVVDREPLPYAAEVLYQLSQRFYIHFVSHNPKPRALYDPLHDWITDHFPLPGFDLTIFGARNCKVDYMDGLGDVWGVIEDKPSTLRKAVSRGYITIGRTTALNRHEDIPGVGWFDEWDELFMVGHLLDGKGSVVV